MKAQSQEHRSTTHTYLCSAGRQSFGEWQHPVPPGHNAALIAPASWAAEARTGPIANRTNTTLCLPKLPSDQNNMQNSRKQNCIILQLGTLKLFLCTGCFILPVWFDLIMWMHFLLILIPSATLLSFLSLYFPSPCYLGSVTPKEMGTAATQIMLCEDSGAFRSMCKELPDRNYLFFSLKDSKSPCWSFTSSKIESSVSSLQPASSLKAFQVAMLRHCRLQC